MAEYTVTILGTDYKIRKWKVLYLTYRYVQNDLHYIKNIIIVC